MKRKAPSVSRICAARERDWVIGRQHGFATTKKLCNADSALHKVVLVHRRTFSAVVH
jgi:hypothetical protein